MDGIPVAYDTEEDHREVTKNLRSLAPALVEKARALEYEVAARRNQMQGQVVPSVTDADASGALRGTVEHIAGLADKVESLIEIQANQLEAADLQLRFLKARMQAAEENADSRAASAVHVEYRKTSAESTMKKTKHIPLHQRNTGIMDVSDPKEIRGFLERELFDFTKLEGVGTTAQAGAFGRGYAHSRKHQRVHMPTRTIHERLIVHILKEVTPLHSREHELTVAMCSYMHTFHLLCVLVCTCSGKE